MRIYYLRAIIKCLLHKKTTTIQKKIQLKFNVIMIFVIKSSIKGVLKVQNNI